MDVTLQFDEICAVVRSTEPKCRKLLTAVFASCLEKASKLLHFTQSGFTSSYELRYCAQFRYGLLREVNPVCSLGEERRNKVRKEYVDRKKCIMIKEVLLSPLKYHRADYNEF
jgi:hypothetical protein